MEEHQRRVLPLGSTVRRRLDLTAGGEEESRPSTSTGRQGPPEPRVAIVRTPKKHRGVIRNIRRQVGGIGDAGIDALLRQLELEDRITERRMPMARLSDDGDDGMSDVAEDSSGEEYVPEPSGGAVGVGSAVDVEARPRARLEEVEGGSDVGSDVAELFREDESEMEFSGFVNSSDSEGLVESGDSESESDSDSEDERERRRGGGGRRRARAGRRARARGRGQRRRNVDDDDAGWSEDPTPPIMHPFRPIPGLAVAAPTTPLGFLQLFLTRELLVYLMAETVSYANYMRGELGLTTSYLWSGCNLSDLAHYLGLIVFFGMFPHSDVRSYWKRSFFLATPNVPALMSRDRFLAFDRYFHAFNRKAIPRNNRDRLILVRPVMDYLRQRCKDVVIPSQNLSLDEGMMAYKGRLAIKVYNPKKPKKYGVKIFFITESDTGYVIDFEIYSGVTSTLRNIVFGLVDRFRHQGYHLFMDNYYNSVALAQELYDAGIHCSGTLRLSRRGAPKVLQRMGKDVGPDRLPRGESIWRRKDAVFIVLWKGARIVPMITTSHEPITEDYVEKRKRRRDGRVVYEEVTVQRPTVIRHYTQHMGGVDLFDQLVQYYSFARRTRRWTHKLLKYLLQMTFQNGYTCYLGFTTDRKKLTHYQFMDHCAEKLVRFDEAEWPSVTGPIASAPSLPVEERADTYRRARHLLHQRRRRDAMSSSSSEDDPAPVPSPGASPVAPSPPASPSPPSASPPLVRRAPAPPTAAPAPAAPVPAPAPAPAPARAPTPPLVMAPPDAPAHASRRVVDPPCRLQPGDHELEQVPGGSRKQKRCRVCHMSGKRSDSRFQCRTCKIPLCRTKDCAQRYHTLRVYWTQPVPGTREGRQDRGAAYQQ